MRCESHDRLWILKGGSISAGVVWNESQIYQRFCRAHRTQRYGSCGIRLYVPLRVRAPTIHLFYLATRCTPNIFPKLIEMAGQTRRLDLQLLSQPTLCFDCAEWQRIKHILLQRSTVLDRSFEWFIGSRRRTQAQATYKQDERQKLHTSSSDSVPPRDMLFTARSRGCVRRRLASLENQATSGSNRC